MRTSARTRVLAATAACSLGLLSSPAGAQCSRWAEGFQAPGVDGTVYALASFDDGSGPALYAGGDFTAAGSTAAKNLARWDGASWTALDPSGMAGHVFALAAFDDGSGPALYAGGWFYAAGGVSASGIARWNGSAWTPLGSGVAGGAGFVSALAIYDDGSGPALFAAGSFSSAGGTSASNVAKWDGASWSALGSGVDSDVFALAVHDDGSGPALFAGGRFENAGGGGAVGIARWDGSTWSPVGGGMTGGEAGPYVRALLVHDDGSGPALYAGGGFDSAGGVQSNKIARWDGSTWSALDSGVSGTTHPHISSLAVFDEGSGPRLFAAGEFTSAGSASTSHIARWDGTAWSSPGSGLEGAAFSLASFDDGSGPGLFVGGSFREASGVVSQGVAKWDGAGFEPVGPGAPVSDPVAALAVHDDGSGTALYLGGAFTSAGDASASSIARWDGTSFSEVGGGFDGQVLSLAVYDDGTGPALYAGGWFTHAGGAAANHIARWDGAVWTDVGGGTDGGVYALAVYDDGTGPALFAGGSFTTPGNYIAKWDGASWTSLASGVDLTVVALTVFDDGSGDALYAGGFFLSAGGVGTQHIGRWNGASWTELGVGTTAGVFALSTFDDGSGPALIAGGTFLKAGDIVVNGIARWDGAGWSPLGSGLASIGLSWIGSLQTFDDGSGNALYAGGQFTTVGGVLANYIARWNGSSWSALDRGLEFTAAALAVADLGGTGTPDLYAGGSFRHAGPMRSWGLARWLGCPHSGTATCFGDGTGAPCPCGNSGNPGRGCQNSGGTGGALLAAGGTPSLGSDSLWLTASGERTSALSIFLQGDLEIAATTYGDGLRCTGGQLRRLFVRNAAAGIVYAPAFGEPSISMRSAAKGDPLSAGDMRMYQTYYRDPNAAFCPDPPGNTWNVTNALRIDWTP